MIDVTREELEEMSGWETKDISERLQCHPSHVRRLYLRFGVERNKRVIYHRLVTPEWLQERIDWTNREIAEAIGCKQRYVNVIFKRHGIKRAKQKRSEYRTGVNLHCPCDREVECRQRVAAGLGCICEVGQEVDIGITA